MTKQFLCLLFCMQSFCLLGQTADPDAFGESILILDINTMRFDKILPFDRPFIIHLKNIPSSYDAITISINKNKRIGAALKKSKGLSGTVSPKSDEIINLEPWIRPTGGGTLTEGDVVQTEPLPPNSDYIVKVSVGVEGPLSTSEASALAKVLKEDASVAESINDLANAPPIQPASILSQYKLSLNEQFGNAIKDFNPDFIFTAPDWLDVLNDLRSFRERILEAKSDIDELKNDDIDQRQLMQLANKVAVINWGTIQLDTDNRELQTIIVAIKTLKDADAAKTDGATAISTTLDEIETSINTAITARDRLRTKMVDQVAVPNTFALRVLNSTYRADFVNNAKFHINLDAGYAYVARVDRFMPYSGFNIYFRPVDKSIPISRYKGLGNQLAVRTSLLIGISLGSIEKENVRKGLIDNKAFVLGVGFRVLSFLKLNGGVFCHYRNNKNPVINIERYHSSLSPFVSLSLDLDVKPLFSGLSDSIFK